MMVVADNIVVSVYNLGALFRLMVLREEITREFSQTVGAWLSTKPEEEAIIDVVQNVYNACDSPVSRAFQQPVGWVLHQMHVADSISTTLLVWLVDKFPALAADMFTHALRLDMYPPCHRRGCNCQAPSDEPQDAPA